MIWFLIDGFEFLNRNPGKKPGPLRGPRPLAGQPQVGPDLQRGRRRGRPQLRRAASGVSGVAVLVAVATTVFLKSTLVSCELVSFFVLVTGRS